MIETKADFRQYLINHRNSEYGNAPATAEEYADWWGKAIEEDLREFVIKGEHIMHFKRFQKDGPLLVLTKSGELPEKFEKKFQAYKVYGLDMGYQVEVNYIPDSNEGRIYTIKVTND
jgi:hypothetical protein